MTAATMDLAHPGTAPQGTGVGRRGRGRPAGLTLEDAILGAWEDLATRGLAACPVCGDALTLAGCRSCGSELSRPR